jgi:tetratricopeptide (TPR) repeat protein
VHLLEPPDTHCLSAAIGWLELGNPAEARAELDKVSSAYQRHPDVLEVRWMLCAEQRDWPAALSAARAILQAAPDRSSGWLHQAYALRRVSDGGVEKAWDALLPAFEKFPKEPVIAYNLACYGCQMNRLTEAQAWLKRALKIGGKEKIKEMALRDSDLEPLWEEIRSL